MASVKIEIGGGATPRGDGFINLDKLDCADQQVDLEMCSLPFADDSVDEVYSAHCLEHVDNAVGVLGEILRICKVGSSVELRFPHWLHPMASCSGHVHVLSDRQVEIWCKQSSSFWPQSSKRFELVNIHYQIDVAFHELRQAFPTLTEHQVAKYIPSCCHEIRCKMKVVSQ